MRNLLISLVVAATATTATAQTTNEAESKAPAVETTETEVSFISAEGVDLGMAVLIGTQSGLLIRLDLRDLPADQWLAFHIHEGGECDVEGDFDSAGDHWNESDAAHGYLAETGPHSGDMPNIHVGGDGRLLADVFNAQAFLSGDTGNVMGRTLVLHFEADDYATQPSGDAGDPLACAVIE